MFNSKLNGYEEEKDKLEAEEYWPDRTNSDSENGENQGFDEEMQIIDNKHSKLQQKWTEFVNYTDKHFETLVKRHYINQMWKMCLFMIS